VALDNPPPSTDRISARMKRVRRADTKPELAVRRRLHALGLRYRVDTAPIVGLRSRADVVFTRRRIAVFIDGCFWHACPTHGTMPKSNAEWWRNKLEANVRRDLAATEALKEAGWTVLRFWEHDDPDDVALSVLNSVNASTSATR